MKVDLSKDWCLRMAKLEAETNAEIEAGMMIPGRQAPPSGAVANCSADRPAGGAITTTLTGVQLTPDQIVALRRVERIQRELADALEALDKACTAPDYTVVHPSDFVGAQLQENALGMIAIRDPEIRANVGTTPCPGAEIAFVYLGPTIATVPLGDGTVRRQIGLKLRSANTCNVVYVMWWIEPSQGIHVSVKSNPGMDQHSQCGDKGYINLNPITSDKVPEIKVGDRHILRARIDGYVFCVTADDIVAWKGSLPPEAFAFDGPVGIRTDNGQFDVEYRLLNG